jgi:hypothetical protein
MAQASQLLDVGLGADLPAAALHCWQDTEG